MTLGEKLLTLTTEYQTAVENRTGWGDVIGDHDTREPSVIAAEYEATVLELVATSVR